MPSPPRILRKRRDKIAISAVQQVVADYYPDGNATMMEIHQKIRDLNLRGESYRSSSDQIIISESHFRGSNFSGSMQYEGNYQSGQTPAHDTAELWHFNDWSGSLYGALNILNANSSHGSQVWFKGLISQSYGQSTSTAGFGGRFVCDSAIEASGGVEWVISGKFPQLNGYYTSSAVQPADIAKLDGSNFTGSVIIGLTGSLSKANFVTGDPSPLPIDYTGSNWYSGGSAPSNHMIGPGRGSVYNHTMLSASIELAWNTGNISGSDSSHGLQRAVKLGGVFDTSASLFNDPSALITKIQNGSLFAIKTEASGALLSSPDGASIDRSTKPGSTGNYFAKRNADPNYKTSVEGAQSEYELSSSKATHIKGTATGRKIPASRTSRFIK